MTGLSEKCGVCGSDYQFGLPLCPICHKRICDNCTKRRGGNTFCSTECAHAFFQGYQEEEIDESEIWKYEDIE